MLYDSREACQNDIHFKRRCSLSLNALTRASAILLVHAEAIAEPCVFKYR